jgi:hypothetical protein
MTYRERVTFWLLTIACAFSRGLAVARSPWDWDEVLFIGAVRAYDVTKHHPHPPGFPLFVALGKAAAFVTGDPFRALQAVTIVAACALFPALFLVAREIGFGFWTAIGAALLFVFAPNVWLFGGTAFSDITSIALAVVAALLLLRGRDERIAFFIGAIVLGCAIAVRIQNGLIGLCPFVMAMNRRGWRDSIPAVSLAAIVATAFYAGAAFLTCGWTAYLAAMRAFGPGVLHTDSFLNPERPPLSHLFRRFFVDIYGWTPAGILITAFVIISIVAGLRRRDRALLIVALTFGPFAGFAWLMLDPTNIGRYSIGYFPLLTLLAADGIARVARERTQAQLVILSLLVVMLMGFTLPALREVRSTIAPPVAAVDALRAHVSQGDALYAGSLMIPFMEVLAPEYRTWILVDDERSLPIAPASPRRWLVTEIERTHPTGFVFTRPRGALWSIVRRRYFTAALEPLVREPRFVDGWLDAGQYRHDEWRTMASHAGVILPAANGPTVLRLAFDSPHAMRLDIAVDGSPVASTVLTAGWNHRDYEISVAGPQHRLDLAAGDDQLRLRQLAWGPRG